MLRPSPEFFVARNTTSVNMVAVAAIICGLLPLAFVVTERTIRAISGRAAAVFHAAVMAVLVTILLMPPLKRGGLVVASLPVAASAGITLALAYGRFAVLRFFLTVLAPAALVIPGLFLLDRDIREALVPSTIAGATITPGRTPPIVVVVFDEFPANSLLDANRQIDAVRYPNFAALASDSYWFRNASTVSGNTRWAVPAIVSGQYPTIPRSVPTLRYYPSNLFTLLGSRYEMHVFGRFLQLCPGSTCHHDLAVPDDSVTALLADLSIVWLHTVLPEFLSADLPVVAGDWRGFARDRQRTSNERGNEFDRFLSTIDGRPAQLSFLHTLIPHMPFEYVPSGRQYRAQDYQTKQEQGRGLFQRASAEYADALHQRHLLQVGFVDTLIGRLIARLREVGAYDSALVIVTADHGASYREGVSRRSARGANIADIMLVPLIVKVPAVPGQPAGVIVDRNVEVVDILPTIASVLSAELPGPVPGRSLLDLDAPERPAKTFVRQGSRVSIDAVTNWAQHAEDSLQRKLRRFGSGSTSLYTTPGTRGLEGRPIADLVGDSESSVRVEIENPGRFANVDIAGGVLPLHVRGRVHGAAAPLTLAIAINGTVAATTLSYEEAGVHVFGTLVPEERFQAGANRVDVFPVDDEQSARLGPHSGSH